ncbi:3-oxoacid CoA-transferase subunit B [Terasakiella pusilla]|uniref:3-oxoacid CoA-transferase subunit B n=1 Tax=Terasakiella pusilla TaxID=64973 RepID=UPI0004904C5C|nr:3-oxoacid CoA-transferase subunit B [Terasakiella pusilla]
MSLDAKTRMLHRAAHELKDGMFINLGIGLPTQLVNYVDEGANVCLHSENGMSGVGPLVPYEKADRNLIDAGGGYVSRLAGSAFFDSALSFAMVRRGRLDLTVLGAFEVAMNGDLANWMIPGKFTPGIGGAIELAQKTPRVVILTTHQDKKGQSKIVRECSLPLTAKKCVNRIYTDMAVMDVLEDGLILKEIADGLSIEDVVKATAAPLQIADTIVHF